jgi:putative oxidoreductase
LLAAFLVPVTLIFHGFWNYVGAEQQMQMANFLKNIAIMGGLLYIASRPADVYSLDARLHLTRRLRRRPISTRRV